MHRFWTALSNHWLKALLPPEQGTRDLPMHSSAVTFGYITVKDVGWLLHFFSRVLPKTHFIAQKTVVVFNN